VDDAGDVLEVRRCTQPEDSLLAFLRFQNLPNAASSWMVDAEMFDCIGVFDPELAILEDWEMSLRIARFCNPISISEPLSQYRVHAGNRSRDLDLHIAPGFRALNRLFADETLPVEIRSREREVYARFFAMLCGGAFRARRWRACLYWGSRAVWNDPRMMVYIASLPVRRVRRAR
jgi:hypothetical protein